MKVLHSDAANIAKGQKRSAKNMKYTTEELITKLESGVNVKYIYFWGHKKTDIITKSCFSG